MNKTACLLNSPELGGAERSFITQIGLLDKKDSIDLFYPEIGPLKASSELKSFVEKKICLNLRGFEYLESLYNKSRTGKFGLILSLFLIIQQAFLLKLTGFFNYKNLWCNGNKVFYPIIIGALLFRYKGVILWHLRDYPATGSLNRIISKLAENFGCFKLVLISNSDSVKKAFGKDFKAFDIHRAYNPVEKTEFVKENVDISVIGFAGMSAPWKGLHELYLWASLYEAELIKIGVKEVAVFGKNIYHTKGDHQSYDSEIEKLSKKFPSSLISKKGLVPPSEIFSTIDIMLHLSVKEEPFGRVLLESFAHGVPCISTGLGGAAELMDNFPELKHYSFDYGGLTLTLERLIKEPALIKDIRLRGLGEYRSFQDKAISDLKIIESLYFQ